MTKHVVVVDYDTQWVNEFNTLKALFKKSITLDVDIEHIGSTSVLHLAAKPIIDIMIVIDTFEEFEEVKRCLESIGYFHNGDQGIKQREVFKLKEENGSFRHHLYVGYRSALSLKNQFTFRDHLRSHPKDVIKYGNLKKELAKKYPYDIDSYVEGKTDFVIGILRQYDFSEEEINEIVGVNKKEK